MSLQIPQLNQVLPYPPNASAPGDFSSAPWQNWFVRIWGILSSNRQQTNSSQVLIWMDM